MEQALLEEPLNPRILRILGQITEKQQNANGAGKYMQAAVKLSIRESMAVFWLMQNAYRQKDIDSALRYVDILLWYRPQLIKQLVPLLGSIAENDMARPKLEVLLARNPPWRSQFFALLPLALTDVRTPLKLLMYLRKTPAQPTQ